MAHHGLAKPRFQSSDGKKISDGLSQNSTAVETLARIPDLVHAPRSHHDEIQDLYQRSCLDAEELVEKQTVIMKKLAAGELSSSNAAGIAMERTIPSCQAAHSILLCVALGCNAILAALSPRDVSLVEDSVRYCDDVLSLARVVAPSRPLGASHFPLCLMVAYLTATDAGKLMELRGWLVDFQKDFACSSWLDMATKARESYWTARRACFDEYERGDCGEAGERLQEKDESFCAVQ